MSTTDETPMAIKIRESDPVLDCFLTGSTPKGVNYSMYWIPVNTNNYSLANMKLGNTGAPDSVKIDSTVRYLVIKVYDLAETDKISKALQTGDISISDYGTIKYGSTVIHTGLYDALPEAIKQKEIGGSTNLNSGTSIDEYRAKNIYNFDKNMALSKNHKYILYRPKNQQGDADRYYLLINPLYTKSFQKYYRQLYIDKNTDNTALPPAGSDMRKAIIKHCNAFTIKGKATSRDSAFISAGKAAGGVNDSNPEIYLDPFCAVMVDNNTARLNFTYKTSVTSSWYKDGFFQNDVIRNQLIGSIVNIAESTFELPFSCDNANQQSITLLKYYQSQMSTDSSFVRDYINATKAKSNTTTDNPYKTQNDFDSKIEPGCPPVALTECSITQFAYSDIVNSPNFISCGADGKPVVPTDGGGDGGGGDGGDGGGDGGGDNKPKVPPEEKTPSGYNPYKPYKPSTEKPPDSIETFKKYIFDMYEENPLMIYIILGAVLIFIILVLYFILFR